MQPLLHLQSQQEVLIRMTVQIKVQHMRGHVLTLHVFHQPATPIATMHDWFSATRNETNKYICYYLFILFYEWNHNVVHTSCAKSTKSMNARPPITRTCRWYLPVCGTAIVSADDATSCSCNDVCLSIPIMRVRFQDSAIHTFRWFRHRSEHVLNQTMALHSGKNLPIA